MASGSKHRRNEKKCKEYRAKVGKPRGPGRPGSKSGKGFVPMGKPAIEKKKAVASSKKKK